MTDARSPDGAAPDGGPSVAGAAADSEPPSGSYATGTVDSSPAGAGAAAGAGSTTAGPTAGGPTAGGPTAGGPTAGGPTAGGPTAGGPTAGGPAASPAADGSVVADGSATADDLAAEDGDVEAAVAAAEMQIDIEVMAIVRERDEYLDALRRLQADFENYKKRMDKQKIEHVDRAVGELVSKLLPVCDTADLAIAHGGGEEVKQVWTALMEALERVGLERIDPVGEPFDPTVHDAVAHDPGDGGVGDPEVTEVFRTGYRWKGRVLRPAMVKVKG